MNQQEPHSRRADAGAHAPLAGTRVVECASYVSGPMAAQILADLGADVIKVEPPAGDPLRNFGLRHRGLSAMWVNINRGKRSVVIDLKTPEGVSKFRDLITTADVYIQNWRPGVAESLGISDDSLAALNPRLVRVCITGFGHDGPWSHNPVFDLLLQATSGLAFSEGQEDRPTALRSLIADKTTAVFAANAALTALLSRSRSGQGGRLDVAMLDVLAYFNFPDLGQHRTFLESGSPRDAANGRSGLLRTSDGFIAVSPVSGEQIGRAVAAVGHAEWTEVLRRAAKPTELTNILFDRLEGVTRTRPTAYWVDRFEKYGVPVAPVWTLDEHLRSDQVLHSRLYSAAQSPAGEVRQVRFPMRVDGSTLREAGPAPSLGAHSSLLQPKDRVGAAD